MLVNVLNEFYRWLCKVEEWVVSAFIVGVTSLVFIAAITRYFGHPINWAQDTALLLTAWIVFLGADVALRDVGFIRVEILFKKFSERVQKVVHVVFTLISVLLLAVILIYGIQLALDNTSRLFQTLGISYAWATISAPVGSFLMIITLGRKLYFDRGRDGLRSEGREAI